ncbi:MAG: phenylacetate-CoA oxygenase subunit PaaI [Bacteroidetes bacterium]|nr:MAG: phenylacetate-CoA oxygenase subunit PaaI [Bacteroidota bacterium]
MEHKEKFYLQIADNALILSHRLSEYCSNAPFLEEDLANTNVALDLIGLAESVYTELASQKGTGTADDYAYRRTEEQFFNCTMTELDYPDFAHLMVRQFFMDNFHFHFFSELVHSKDEFLSALALKSIKEVTYHLRRSSEWIIRMGDGTEEAHQRMIAAIERMWSHHEELFTPSEADLEMLNNNVAPNLSRIKELCMQKVQEIFYFAKLAVPETIPNAYQGKKGIHTEQMGHILSEMQFLPGKYPEAVW